MKEKKKRIYEYIYLPKFLEDCPKKIKLTDMVTTVKLATIENSLPIEKKEIEEEFFFKFYKIFEEKKKILIQGEPGIGKSAHWIRIYTGDRLFWSHFIKEQGYRKSDYKYSIMSKEICDCVVDISDTDADFTDVQNGCKCVKKNKIKIISYSVKKKEFSIEEFLDSVFAATAIIITSRDVLLINTLQDEEAFQVKNESYLEDLAAIRKINKNKIYFVYRRSHGIETVFIERK